MLRANFFFKFFKTREKNSYKIVKYNSNENFSLQDQINSEIKKVDQKISENSKALVEAQLVKFRSTFSKSSNFIEQLGRNVYKTKLEESINWHQKNLKELYLKRRELVINLEKLRGVFWINRIKRLLRIILMGFLFILILLIFVSGFMIIIYLMPLILLLFLGYYLSTKRY
tara:strand:- start:764 stop:1276 length:513 start_codon:yes stop_codon:yes gene_type:complete